MRDIVTLAAALDAKKIRVPQSLVVQGYDKVYLSTADQIKTFAGMAKLLEERHIENDEECQTDVRRFFKELNGMQNFRLWNGFIASEGCFLIGGEVEEGMAKSSFYTSSAEIVQKETIHYEPTLLYHFPEEEDNRGMNLSHELGHWVDDSSYEITMRRMNKGTLPPNAKIHAIGFHSNNGVWEKIKTIDEALFPEGDFSQAIKIIEQNGYSPDDLPSSRPRAIPEELFSEITGAHFGARGKARLHSPLPKAYMDSIVALDLAILSQEKPIEERYRDRMKLYEALRQPLETYFDIQKMDVLLAAFVESGDSATNKERQTMLIECVQDGLKKLSKGVAKDIGLNMTAASVKKPVREKK